MNGSYGFAGAIEAMAEAILAGNNNMLVDENAVKIAKETADNYATALIRTISKKSRTISKHPISSLWAVVLL